MEYYLKALRQYADFKGRAIRKEYWMFVLFNIIFSATAAVLDRILGTEYVSSGEYNSGGYINSLYSIVLFVPGLAAVVRRLHDVGKSGWMALIILIPIVGWVWILVLLVTDSQAGENKWGKNLKELESK